MPATVIVGGQFGSEGKGKVAQLWAQKTRAGAAVRVGGSNSGHTSLSAPDGQRRVLRQLPTAALLPDVVCVLPPGAYIDPDVLLREIAEVGLAPERLVIDPLAMLISAADIAVERESGLGDRIGSTCSGTGAAVARRIARLGRDQLAAEHPALQPYLGSSAEILRAILDRGGHVVLEGTQGFGLSLLHSPHYPKVTSRDTTAAAAIAEAGLSPRDVDEVVLVTRAFPIRVAGDSGPFGAPELDWGTIAAEGGHGEALSEFTSVTGRLRRVARFDPAIVREAIRANRPDKIVLNHVDYLDAGCTSEALTPRGVRVPLLGQLATRPADRPGRGRARRSSVRRRVDRRPPRPGEPPRLGAAVKPAESDAEADARYERWRSHDPFPEIPPALLNSADLQDYVETTGMISPFTLEPDTLKPASYAIPLEGEVLFWEEDFDERSGKRTQVKRCIELKPGDHLRLKHNPIVYVTLAPVLRLPNYIAARFNLTIMDIYRGLLVGTAALIPVSSVICIYLLPQLHR